MWYTFVSEIKKNFVHQLKVSVPTEILLMSARVNTSMVVWVHENMGVCLP